ncbi:MAG: HAMP domain-containing protein [Myxacorys californica WJT36-NPBG1]|jgi:signal transduction histidine kinase|nr:HAMP domain-containing protein [Myxacorys californica WJT36-NPBG1]
MKAFPLPLRLTIPVTLLLVGCIAGGFSLYRQVSISHERAEDYLTQRAKQTATATAQLLEYVYRRAEVKEERSEGASLLISRLTGDVHLKLIVLCDEFDRVQNSNRYELRNRLLQDTPLADTASVVAQVRQQRAGKVALNRHRMGITAIYPVLLPPKPGQLRSDNIGVLLIDYDLTKLEQRAIVDAQQQSVQTIGVLILLCILVGFLFDQIVTRRARRLVLGSNRLAQGKLTTRVKLQGSDELAQISGAFDRMAGQIQHNTEALQFSEIQLKHQAEQLETTLRELSQMQAQLIQTEKMSGLGQMVAGIAHEINNPVGFIHGNLSYVRQYAGDLLNLVELYQHHVSAPPTVIRAKIEEIDLEFLTEDFSKVLQSMEIGTQRIREIVLSLRNFSRLDEAEYKQADVHEGIDSTLLILQHRLKSKDNHPTIEVLKEYGELPKIECYPGQLNQVFMNLLANAIDALEDAALKTEQPASPQITIRTTRLDAEWIRISIADTGSGIPESVKAKLFDPFFTTKSIGKGTGLGLSISYQIVNERHQGKLYCNSTLGQGTEFVIEVPVHHGAVCSKQTIAVHS